jgi:hypothetical protein
MRLYLDESFNVSHEGNGHEEEEESRIQSVPEGGDEVRGDQRSTRT